MSKIKQYIEEQLENGVDVLHPEYLYLQLEDSYGNHMAEIEKVKKKAGSKQIRTTKNDVIEDSKISSRPRCS